MLRYQAEVTSPASPISPASVLPQMILEGGLGRHVANVKPCCLDRVGVSWCYMTFYVLICALGSVRTVT